MPHARKILLSCFAVLVAGFMFTAFILPTIVRSQLEKQLVRLAEKDARATFVSFSSIGFRLSPTSLFRLAPVVNDLKLHSPYVHIVRTGPNNYNFTEIIERQPQKKDTSPTRFSLNNIFIESGSVDFVDLVPATPTRHSIRDLSVQLPFISNISCFADRYIDPRVSAVVKAPPSASTAS